MGKKSTQIVDITLFGICLFVILLLREYREDMASVITWWIPAIPLGMVALLFGFRGANPDKFKSDE